MKVLLDHETALKEDISFTFSFPKMTFWQPCEIRQNLKSKYMNRETSNIQGELFFQSFHFSLIHSLFANTVLLIKAFLQARS